MTFVIAQTALDTDFIFEVFIVFALLIGLIGYFSYSIWKGRLETCPSPYSGLPLRKAKGLTFSSKNKVLTFLYKMHDYDNRMFDLDKAAFCRETGRIFPDAVNWFDSIRVDWSFLQRRYPGNYVSWGSLNADTQQEIRAAHVSLNGYQTEESSSEPSPRMIEPEIALKKPGPLYVDPESKILLGWKMVPETDLEVMIVQKPKQFSLINIQQEKHE